MDGDPDSWLQADIGLLVGLYGIKIQGGAGANDYWVTTVKISTFQDVEDATEETSGDFIEDKDGVKVRYKKLNKMGLMVFWLHWKH